MTRYASSKFSVGANSASAAQAYRDNYDSIFGKKKYLGVIDDHEIDEIVAEQKPSKREGLRELTRMTEEVGGYDKERAEPDPLASLSPEEYAKLPAPSPAKLQAALDRGRSEAFGEPQRRRGRK